MSQFRLTGRRGQRYPDLVLGAEAGLAEDTVRVAFDVDRMTRRDALQLIDAAKGALLGKSWPPAQPPLPPLPFWFDPFWERAPFWRS